MRILLLLLLLSPVTVFAEGKPVPETVIANPIDALKKSLHKNDEDAAPKKRKPVVKTWMSLSHDTRVRVLYNWQALPETTRPPFPVFRDAYLEKGDASLKRRHSPRARPVESEK